MLLFIGFLRSNIELPRSFQYISCYCLSVCGRGTCLSDVISIHLMLLFINFPLLLPLFAIAFQYISCYCLSLPHVNYTANTSYFNTSHVTVYHIICAIPEDYKLFQYISCYCLSTRRKTKPRFVRISIHLMLLFINFDGCKTNTEKRFQYISCYCLSFRSFLVPSVALSFQYISCYCLSSPPHHHLTCS